MKVLITAASKHGATEEIATALGRVLSESGLETDVPCIADLGDLAEYDAVVLGSAVYAGQWLEPARRLVDEHHDELAGARFRLSCRGRRLSRLGGNRRVGP